MSQQNTSRLTKTNPAAFENFLAAKFERLTGVSHTRSYPYIMNIDPSSICQLRCPGCYTGMINEVRNQGGDTHLARPGARLTSGILDAIFDECGELLFYCHFFNWGEPLLNDDLPSFIRAASAQNIHTKVDTNLSLRLTDAKLEELLTSGLSELAASIDGFSQATYERYRKGGRFELVLGNLTRLAAMRDRLGSGLKIIWNFLVFNFNEHEAPAIAAFCERHGIEFLAKDAITFGAHNDWLPAYRREGKPNPYRTRRPTDLPPSEWQTPAGLIPLYVGRPEGRSCAWHYSYTSVNADGGVAPCCGLYSKKSDFGEVTKAPGSFGRVWNNANFATVRRQFPDAPVAASEGATAACLKCTRSETYRDHYAVLDREIIRRYWSLPEGSAARQLDELFMLLQRSPDAFATAYAERCRTTAIAEPVV